MFYSIWKKKAYKGGRGLTCTPLATRLNRQRYNVKFALPPPPDLPRLACKPPGRLVSQYSEVLKFYSIILVGKMKPPILPFMPLLIKGMFVYKIELYFINVQFSSFKKSFTLLICLSVMYLNT